MAKEPVSWWRGFWLGVFEWAVMLLVLVGIVVACYWGCTHKAKPLPENAVTCPVCGAKLELKDSGK